MLLVRDARAVADFDARSASKRNIVVIHHRGGIDGHHLAKGVCIREVLDSPSPDLLLPGEGEKQGGIRRNICITKEVQDDGEQDGTSCSVVQGLPIDGVSINGASGSEGSGHGYAWQWGRLGQSDQELIR